MNEGMPTKTIKDMNLNGCLNMLFNDFRYFLRASDAFEETSYGELIDKALTKYNVNPDQFRPIYQIAKKTFSLLSELQILGAKRLEYVFEGDSTTVKVHGYRDTEVLTQISFSN